MWGPGTSRGHRCPYVSLNKKDGTFKTQNALLYSSLDIFDTWLHDHTLSNLHSGSPPFHTRVIYGGCNPGSNLVQTWHNHGSQLLILSETFCHQPARITSPPPSPPPSVLVFVQIFEHMVMIAIQTQWAELVRKSALLSGIESKLGITHHFDS